MQSIHLPMEDPPMIEIISPEKNNNDLIKKIKENITTNSKNNKQINCDYFIICLLIINLI